MQDYEKNSPLVEGWLAVRETGCYSPLVEERFVRSDLYFLTPRQTLSDTPLLEGN